MVCGGATLRTNGHLGLTGARDKQVHLDPTGMPIPVTDPEIRKVNRSNQRGVPGMAARG